MYKAFKFRMYPDNNQKILINKTLLWSDNDKFKNLSFVLTYKFQYMVNYDTFRHSRDRNQ